jgi:hypothetical protein
MRRAPYPPFSPDFGRSEFYLFEKVKTALMETIFRSEDELLQGVIRVPVGISAGQLEAVCAHWVARLDACFPKGRKDIQK